MFNFRLLTSPSFWFSAAWNPVTVKTVWFMALVFGALAVVGIVVLVVAGRRSHTFDAPALRRIAAPLIFSGVVGEVFTFFLYQQMPVLSARFWFLFLFLLFIVWLAVALRGFFVTVPKLKAVASSRAEFEKYLPQPKKKK